MGRPTCRQTGSSTDGFWNLSANAAIRPLSIAGVWPICHSRLEYTSIARRQSPSSIAQRHSFSFASAKSNFAKASAVGFAQALRHAKRSSSERPSGAAVIRSSGIGITISSLSAMPATTTSSPGLAWTGIAFERTSRLSPSGEEYSNSSSGNHSTPSRIGRTRYVNLRASR